MDNLLRRCEICPRKCGVNRIEGKKGVCGASDKIVASRAALHFWEEPGISGKNGSGAVFFSGCNLRCIYCQNAGISQKLSGKEITKERLTEIFFELKEKGAENINLVTPTHFALSIKDAIKKAKEEGFDLPFIYNCSGYENVETLKLLEGFIDIYLPDFKYIENETARTLSNAPDYPEICKKAIREMVRQTGKIEFDERGMVKKGVIVRHLVLPGYTKESKRVIKYLHNTFGEDIFISIMNQYTPMKAVNNHPVLNRKLSEKEYDDVLDYAIRIGVENAYIQEGETAEESFIPEFDFTGI